MVVSRSGELGRSDWECVWFVDSSGEKTSSGGESVGSVMSMRSSRRWEVASSISRALSEKRRSRCRSGGDDGGLGISTGSSLLARRREAS